MIMSPLPSDPAFCSALNDLKFPVVSGLGAQLYLSTIPLFLPFNYKQMQIWQLWICEHCIFCVRLQLRIKQPACQNSLVGRQHLKNIFPNWRGRKHWAENKWPCSAKFRQNLAWKPWSLPSQLCESNPGLGLSFLLCQLPAVWSQASCFFSMTSVSQLQYWQKTKPNIKDIRWSIAVIRRLKLDQQKRIRSLHLQHPSKKKKKTFSTARKATYPDDSQQGN